MKQDKTAGRKLLAAGVRIILDEGVNTVVVDGRNTAYYYCAGSSVTIGQCMIDCCAGSYGVVLNLYRRPVGVANRQADGLGGLVRSGCCLDCNLGGAFSGAHYCEGNQFVAGRGELHGLGGGAVNLCGALCSHANLNFSYAFFKCEYVDGCLDGLAGTQYARQGSDSHERRLHGNIFLCVTEGAFVGCNYHYSYATYIHRQFDGVLVLALLKGERAEHLDNRVEAVVFLGAYVNLLVAADAQHLAELATDSAHYVVVDIPGVYAKGFAGIHEVPWIRSLE